MENYIENFKTCYQTHNSIGFSSSSYLKVLSDINKLTIWQKKTTQKLRKKKVFEKWGSRLDYELTNGTVFMLCTRTYSCTYDTESGMCTR